MKKYIFLLLALFFIVACNDDDDGYSLDKFWVNIATVENPNNGSAYFLTLDNGTRLWVAATNYQGYRPQTGQRIIADYTILNDKPEGSTYDHDVKLNDAYNILTKGIFYITPETQDSIGNDPIGINEIWIGSDYLNVRFYYGAYNKVHYLSLVQDLSKEYTDGKIHLELRHNAHDDSETNRINGIASFLLSSLLDNTVTSASTLSLAIHVNLYGDSEKVYDFTYHYNENRTSVSDLDCEIFNEYKEGTAE